jgi:hypothetical protein
VRPRPQRPHLRGASPRLPYTPGAPVVCVHGSLFSPYLDIRPGAPQSCPQ